MKFLDGTGVTRLWEHISSSIDTRVPMIRTINGKTLSNDIVLTVEDIEGITDTKVNTVLSPTTKGYLLGTSTIPLNDFQAVNSIADTGVFLTEIAGELHADQLQTTKIAFLDKDYFLHFRDPETNVYSVGTLTTNSIGDESTPVYVNNKGIIMACTNVIASSAGKDGAGNIIADTYLKISGGTVTGEVNSSATVNLSSAAFRNIKAVDSSVEIIAGITAIPTGEIWVRYE